MKNSKMEQTCERGHTYEKSTDCPVCPICERMKTEGPFRAILSSPASNALESAGITNLQELANHTESEILKLHGMGPASIPKLRAALSNAGLRFRDA
ncbi:RNA polymerase, alpha chain C terminal domain [Sphaerochaeta associata]|uniref:RNA polymerase alpha subunit C-terminal domain-containing protein n=1 Tax=Sphaerochaeta associata TaxID=1129264 RepID=A0ABY4D823_9SPIR|nr:DNA-directed RNA polymerase subunit alpha C-terminal domain-containing protein [Sphaerochaeta associata]UOM50434.1 hypothetical protein MUG09_12805 [Sphaerochaeta associata]SMP41766.1 RNA polymerase, alpha chain C terminal domain [Sphaerochaeta associata]